MSQTRVGPEIIPYFLNLYRGWSFVRLPQHTGAGRACHPQVGGPAELHRPVQPYSLTRGGPCLLEPTSVCPSLIDQRRGKEQ